MLLMFVSLLLVLLAWRLIMTDGSAGGILVVRVIVQCPCWSDLAGDGRGQGGAIHHADSTIHMVDKGMKDMEDEMFEEEYKELTAATSKRNFCDLYAKPFPKLMRSIINPGLVVMMTGTAMTRLGLQCNTVGTGAVVQNKGSFEAIGSVWNDWNMDTLEDVEAEAE